MSITAADKLIKLMLSWISQREACAQKLKKMADELESLRDKCNIGETMGKSWSVLGAASLLGAGVATVLTGGAAAPLLAVTGTATMGLGITVSVVSKLVEHLSSSKTMKEAQTKEEESNSIAQEIERQFEELKEELMKLRPYMGPDDLDQHVMMAFMAAVGRRSGNSRVIRLLEDVSFVFDRNPQRHTRIQSHGSRLLTKPPILEIANVLKFFAYQPKGKKIQSLFTKVAAEKITKTMSSAVFKTAGVMVAGKAAVLAFSLPEAIDNWKELIKRNHVTEASQLLRDTGNDILETTSKLEELLNDIRKELERLAV